MNQSDKDAIRRSLEAKFGEHGIDHTQAGFYNSGAFKRLERRDSSVLEDYAQYVLVRDYDHAYLERARSVIPHIVNFLHRELIRDGRLGACHDAALAMSKILEQFDFWCFIQAGSLTIDFPSESGLGTRYWAHLANSTQMVGHAWIVVPPFCTIDIAISRQQRAEEQRRFLPEYVLAEKSHPVEGVSLEDMVDQDILRETRRAGVRIPTIHEVMAQNSGAANVLRKFRPFAISHSSTTLKYFLCAITAAEERFEDHRGHCFSGRTTPEVYRAMCSELEAVLGPR